MRRMLLHVVWLTASFARSVAAQDEVTFFGEPAKSPTKVSELIGHEGEVLDAIYLPNGTLLTAGADGTLRNWDVTTGKQIAQLHKHPQPITKLRVGANAGQILAFAADGAISVWQSPAPKRSWGPEQAIGPPDSDTGDMHTAWASATPDDQPEWLLLEYAEPIDASAVRIHENFNSGAVDQIELFDDAGKVTVAWRRDDEWKDRETADRSSHSMEVSLQKGTSVKRVRLSIDSPHVSGWNEIDAVGLVDDMGNVHWASKAAASSTFAERSGNSRSLPVRLAPPPVYKIPADAQQLSHVDDSAEGKQSFGGSGHAVKFERPEDAPYLVGIKIFGSRYGHSRPPAEDFEVALLDSDLKVITRLKFPYAMFERGEEKWVALGVDGVEVPKSFAVAVNFNAHQTKGVYVGKDANVDKTHSLVGLAESGFKPVEEEFDWMIRAYVAVKQSEPTKLSSTR